MEFRDARADISCATTNHIIITLAGTHAIHYVQIYFSFKLEHFQFFATLSAIVVPGSHTAIN